MKAISLFSGAGGMDIGVLQAGFELLACIEIDPYACQTLRAAAIRENRPTLVLEQDIRKINPTDLLAQFDLSPGDLDLLCGGPPCQSFSQIGKQDSLADERGLLLFEMVRFAEILRPKVILIEQVKGILIAKDKTDRRGGVLVALSEALKALDYHVKMQVILAADYGVPQMRERVFVVATQGDNITFEFPPPTHRKPNQLFDPHLPVYLTVGDALEGLSEPTPKIKGTPPADSHMDVTTLGDRRRIKGVPEGAWLSSQVHLPADQLCGLTKKDTTKFRRLARHEPALTLRCGEIFFHPVADRILTPREYMRIHGYPDDYILMGPIKSRSGRVRFLDQHRQVANSVPPPLAHAIATAIMKAIVCQPSLKSTVIA
jgi:DNA (cytosine-5)-methyltransferase 1